MTAEGGGEGSEEGERRERGGCEGQKTGGVNSQLLDGWPCDAMRAVKAESKRPVWNCQSQSLPSICINMSLPSFSRARDGLCCCMWAPDGRLCDAMRAVKAAYERPVWYCQSQSLLFSARMD